MEIYSSYLAGKNFDVEGEDIETIYNKFSLIMEPYICLNIKSQIFEELEITLSPKISVGNRAIVDSLKYKYCSNLIIHESELKECIRWSVYKNVKLTEILF